MPSRRKQRGGNPPKRISRPPVYIRALMIAATPKRQHATLTLISTVNRVLISEALGSHRGVTQKGCVKREVERITRRSPQHRTTLGVLEPPQMDPTSRPVLLSLARRCLPTGVRAVGLRGVPPESRLARTGPLGLAGPSRVVRPLLRVESIQPSVQRFAIRGFCTATRRFGCFLSHFLRARLRARLLSALVRPSIGQALALDAFRQFFGAH